MESTGTNITPTTRFRLSGPRCLPQLEFQPLTTDVIPLVKPYFEQSLCRTCDFTVGGSFMWASYFDYSYCILGDTLYMKGVTEDDVTRPAFSIPVGATPLKTSVQLLKEYCRREGIDLIFSAVPEEFVEPLKTLGAQEVIPLDDWSDYLYSAESLATLSGKKLAKKRNHVNRFMADHPDYMFEPLDEKHLEEVRSMFEQYHLPLSKAAIADVEREQVLNVLASPDLYGFEGAVLSVPGLGPVAFTLGEVKGDTLFVHIEKMRHDVSGAGETVNHLFAEMMCRRHPQVEWINREEDVGDPGLRYAKESYHPARLLRKFNVTF